MHGWQKKMWTRVKPILIGLLCWGLLQTFPVMAQDKNDKNKAQPISADEKIPSLLFLEFLGEFETADGEWTDPDNLKEMDLENPSAKENEDHEEN